MTELPPTPPSAAGSTEYNTPDRAGRYDYQLYESPIVSPAEQMAEQLLAEQPFGGLPLAQRKTPFPDAIHRKLGVTSLGEGAGRKTGEEDSPQFAWNPVGDKVWTTTPHVGGSPNAFSSPLNIFGSPEPASPTFLLQQSLGGCASPTLSWASEQKTEKFFARGAGGAATNVTVPSDELLPLVPNHATPAEFQ